ncbi:MAG: phosphoribosyl-ATP diphosphatase [Pseudomonadota bacterium]|nr:phosphoribosyl-ATP diphosphatase [Pseudomonadota bacterium]
MADTRNTDTAIQRLYDTIASRKGGDTRASYTAKLFDLGTEKIAQKLGEEALETVIAAVAENRDALIGESVDLLYHLLVAWADAGISPEDIMIELERRKGTSGLVEKAGRDI